MSEAPVTVLVSVKMPSTAVAAFTAVPTAPATVPLRRSSLGR
jgi:hypothetical protein